jgi:hypothetical protein
MRRQNYENIQGEALSCSSGIQNYVKCKYACGAENSSDLIIDESYQHVVAARRKRGLSLRGKEIVYSEPFNTFRRRTIIGAAGCY